jgi:ABC-type bacteriocin/lantibiotic exporter with double-glycine peptidase domain
MRYYHLIKKILTKKELFQMYFIFFLMVINSLLEVISMGSLLPLLSVMMDSKLNIPLLDQIYILFDKFNISLNLYLALVLMLSIFLIKYLLTIYLVREQSKFILNLKTHLSTRIFERILKKKYKFFLFNTSAELIRNVKNEVDMFINGFFSPILSLILALFISIFLIIFLLSINFKVTTIIFIIFAFSYYAISIFYTKYLKKLGKLRQYHEKFILKYLLESLKSITEVKLFKLENIYIKNFFNHNNLLANQIVSKSIYGVMPKILFELIIILITLSFILYFSLNNLSLKDLFVQILIYSVVFYRLLPSVTSISRHEQKIKYAQPAAKVIKSFLEDEQYSQNLKNFDKNFSFQKSIKLQNIKFTFDKKVIFENLNLEFNKKDKICIIGKNGSGKSTLIKIIAGLIDPDAGEVYVDDYKIMNNLERWIDLVGYVPQETNLIEGTLEENICLGAEKEKVNKVKLNEVIEKSLLTDFLKKYGMNRNLGEYGQKISGGEKQKIALARTLYKSPEVLLFDEATSAMDSNSEDQFINNVKKLFSNQTVILITHKKEHAKFFNKVIDLNNLNL